MRAQHLWWLLPVVAVVEVAAHFAVLRDVVPLDDWRNAARVVAGEWREGDAVVSAPRWTDPLLRLALGAKLPVEAAAASDLFGKRRLWALTVRGAEPVGLAGGRRPDLDQEVGRVRVRRYGLDPRDVLHDFLGAAESAVVSRRKKDGSVETCPWRKGPPEGGGLGQGPVKPAHRATCGEGKGGSWVGVTTLEDYSYAPRRCLRQPAVGKDPVRAEFESVLLGREIVFHGGLYLRHERALKGEPIGVRVVAGDTELGRMVHRDGDGWRTHTWVVPKALQGIRATVRVEVTSRNAKDRAYCWAAKSLR